jgi:predicted nucleotidyltransferase
MLNLYNFTTQVVKNENRLTYGEELSVIYHNIFDYPLTMQDLIKWKASDTLDIVLNGNVILKSGYFYMEDKEGLVYKRLLRKRISAKKMIIAKNAANLMAFIPTIKMVAVTGSLAMENSTNESDIDLLVVTKKGNLWLTRMLTYVILKTAGYKIRKAQDNKETDKLCLNMWLDESSLAWPSKNRNIYTAHEIAQIKPLLNKTKTYNKFLSKNKWILNFWPNAVKIAKFKKELTNEPGIISSLLDKISFDMQYKYMSKKITREVVTRNKALFHPQDWAQVVLGRLSS